MNIEEFEHSKGFPCAACTINILRRDLKRLRAEAAQQVEQSLVIDILMRDNVRLTEDAANWKRQFDESNNALNLTRMLHQRWLNNSPVFVYEQGGVVQTVVDAATKPLHTEIARLQSSVGALHGEIAQRKSDLAAEKERADNNANWYLTLRTRVARLAERLRWAGFEGCFHAADDIEETLRRA